MRSKSASFSILFRTVLLPRLETFDRVRRQYRPLILALALTAIAAAALAVHAVRSSWWALHPLAPYLAALFLLFLPFGLTIRAFYPRTPWGWSGKGGTFRFLAHQFRSGRGERTRFSREIVIPTVDHLLPGLWRLPVEYVSQGDFLDSMLFGYNVGRYAGRDRFVGRLGGGEIDFSWLQADAMVLSSVDRDNKEYVPLFTGWFFAIRFFRGFRGAVLIQPDSAEATLGWFGRSIQEIAVPRGLVLLHLEDPEFEHYFRIHATDQLESRYLLSPAFMQAATAFRKRLGTNLSISFARDCMYLAAPGVVDYFGRPTTRAFADPAFARHLYQAVRGAIDLAACVERNYVMWE